MMAKSVVITRGDGYGECSNDADESGLMLKSRVNI